MLNLPPCQVARAGGARRLRRRSRHRHGPTGDADRRHRTPLDHGALRRGDERPLRVAGSSGADHLEHELIVADFGRDLSAAGLATLRLCAWR